jgi:hypothetical protein
MVSFSFLLILAFSQDYIQKEALRQKRRDDDHPGGMGGGLAAV